jgi:hypothetical protein
MRMPRHRVVAVVVKRIEILDVADDAFDVLGANIVDDSGIELIHFEAFGLGEFGGHGKFPYRKVIVSFTPNDAQSRV